MDAPQRGKWTPVFAGSTTAGAPTYTTQAGFWYRTGDLIFFTCTLVMTALGGAAGSAQISGLPFTCDNNASENVMFCARWSGITFAANYTALGGAMSPGTSLLLPQKSGTAGVAANPLTIAEMAAATTFIFSGCYIRL